MTPSEIEAELSDIRAQFSQLQEQQNIHTKAWASLAAQYRILGAAMLTVAVVLFVLQIWLRESSAMPVVSLLLLQSLPLLLFRYALGSAAAKAVRA